VSAGGDAFEVFFDGDCPLCRREMNIVQRMDKNERVRLTDIASASFTPPPGLTREALMASIHGRRADGTVVTGVEVFREVYTAVGLGRWVALTRLAPVAWALDAAYAWFARHRLRLTGRCTDETCAIDAATPRGAS